jgi:DNA (cytosine-5)-methyltransferase 1
MIMDCDIFEEENMDSSLVSVKSASRKLGLSPQQVRNLCRSGKIPSKKVGNAWIINEAEIIKYSSYNTCGVSEDHAAYNKKEQKGKPIALSFFSGAMGMDIGLEKAGFEVLLACEIDKACRKTITKNKPDIALIGDIRDYTAKEIKEKAGLKANEEIDLIVGGPPCQAFSTAGKRKGFEDERGNVFLTFLERIIELKPKYAVIENVRGILSAALKHRPHNLRTSDAPLTAEELPGGAMRHILKVLRTAGYGVTFNLYNAANFGTPQKRERVVIICSRDGTKAPYLVPTHSEKGDYKLPKWKSFKEAISEKLIEQHHHINFPEKRLKYYRLLGPGQYWKHLPENLQKEALGASYNSGGGKTGFLRRLAWSKPSPTLVTNPAMPATDLAHPEENRPLSIEEYKIIQQFPDSWNIEGSLLEKYKQIGNAVPVGLGCAIGTLIQKLLKKEKIPVFEGFNYSRYKFTADNNWEKKLKKTAQKPKAKQFNLF